jgi:hypothetical protein
MLAQRLKAPSQDNPSNITPMGFIFVCTDKSEKYMLESLTFPQSKAYGHRVFAVKPEDYIFLYNRSLTESGAFMKDEGKRRS